MAKYPMTGNTKAEATKKSMSDDLDKNIAATMPICQATNKAKRMGFFMACNVA